MTAATSPIHFRLESNTLIFTCHQEPAGTSPRCHDRPRVDNNFDAVNHRRWTTERSGPRSACRIKSSDLGSTIMAREVLHECMAGALKCNVLRCMQEALPQLGTPRSSPLEAESYRQGTAKIARDPDFGNVPPLLDSCNSTYYNSVLIRHTSLVSSHQTFYMYV